MPAADDPLQDVEREPRLVQVQAGQHQTVRDRLRAQVDLQLAKNGTEVTVSAGQSQRPAQE